MNKTIVTFTTGQTIPTFLLIKSLYKPGDIVSLVSSKKMQHKEHFVSDSLGLDEEYIKNLHFPEDLEEDWEGMHSLFERTFPNGGEYIVDLTGGTKLMAVAAYDFFSKNRKATFTYVPLPKNGYLILPDNSLNRFSSQVSVKEFLAVNKGLDTTFDSTYGTEKDALSMISAYERGDLNFSDDFIMYITDNKSRSKGIKDLETSGYKKEIISYCSLITHKKDIKDNSVGKGFIEYITGGWFEEYIYYLIKGSFHTDDLQIGTLIRQTDKINRNELDVAFTIDNMLYVIECKVAVDNGLFNSTRYKSDSLKQAFGLNVKSCICTMCQLSEEQKQRAKEMNIVAIDHDIILDKEQFKEAILK